MSGRVAPVAVVVVEDDTAQRGQLLDALRRDRDLTVRGLASTGVDAITLVARTRPDVVVLDLDLADGTSRHIVEQLMAHSPTPILILSAQVHADPSQSAVDALVAGALEALPRPMSWTTERAGELHRTVRRISSVPVIRHPRGSRTEHVRHRGGAVSSKQPVVAIAASTGGPSALATVLADLQGMAAPVLVVQHLHSDFTTGLLEWMARVSALPVEIAVHDELARPGRVYLAPGGVHLRIGAGRRLELHAEPATVHRPSADQLFDSVAQHNAAGIGVLLTGMGDDGAVGLLSIHRNGGQTIAQDEATCAVFGMPRAAHRLGAVSELLPLDRIGAAIQRAARRAPP